HQIEILGFVHPLLKIKVRCSKGTYIRSLAHDLGELMECGAYLKSLVRSAYDPFLLGSSISLDDIKEALAAGSCDRLLFPVDYPLQEWQRQVVSQEISTKIIQGHDILFDCADISTDNPLCVYGPAQNFLAVMKFVRENRLWHPEKVFNL
ncbi:MAG: hypothetical protein EHM12_06375, partial [Dehalococcoidia bacterium]